MYLNHRSSEHYQKISLVFSLLTISGYHHIWRLHQLFSGIICTLSHKQVGISLLQIKEKVLEWAGIVTTVAPFLVEHSTSTNYIQLAGAGSTARWGWINKCNLVRKWWDILCDKNITWTSANQWLNSQKTFCKIVTCSFQCSKKLCSIFNTHTFQI